MAKHSCTSFFRRSTCTGAPPRWPQSQTWPAHPRNRTENRCSRDEALRVRARYPSPPPERRRTWLPGCPWTTHTGPSDRRARWRPAASVGIRLMNTVPADRARASAERGSTSRHWSRASSLRRRASSPAREGRAEPGQATSTRQPCRNSSNRGRQRANCAKPRAVSCSGPEKLINSSTSARSRPPPTKPFTGAGEKSRIHAAVQHTKTLDQKFRILVALPVRGNHRLIRISQGIVFPEVAHLGRGEVRRRAKAAPG